MTRLYLASGDGPIIVTPRAGRWLAARPLDVRSASCIAVDPQHPARVFCTTAQQGVWRSDDAGISWKQVFERVPHDRITALAISQTERIDGLAVAYVGTEPSAVFRSEDGGATWRKCEGLGELPSASAWSFPPRPHTHHVRWIEPDPHDAGRLYVAIEAGALLRSPDGGTVWRDRVPGGPLDTHQLATHRDAPARLWSAAGDGFFESGDAGDTWRKSERGLNHRYCWSVAVDPRDPGTVILSAAASAHRAHDVAAAEGHLYRRANDDGAWEEIRAGLPDARGTRTYALSNSPEPGVFYAGTDAALYRSTDAGATWEQLNVDWPAGYTGARIHVLTAAAARGG